MVGYEIHFRVRADAEFFAYFYRYRYLPFCGNAHGAVLRVCNTLTGKSITLQGPVNLFYRPLGRWPFFESTGTAIRVLPGADNKGRPINGTAFQDNLSPETAM